MKKKIITAVLLAVACTPLVAFGPPLLNAMKSKHKVMMPAIRYELQIGDTKYDVQLETNGYVTSDGSIINTDGHGYFLTLTD